MDVDPDDAVLKVYRQALPTLFTNLAAMPEDLRGHLRYPPDLFAVQAAKFSTYHMTVPQVFYNSEDLWAAPRENYGGEVIAMKPYYVLMKLPQEERLEFLLMTPLTPNKRDNMIAWIEQHVVQNPNFLLHMVVVGFERYPLSARKRRNTVNIDFHVVESAR